MERGNSFRRIANVDDVEHLTGTEHGADGVSRKRSLVRPERQRFNPDHPQYHYQQVAREQSDRIHVQPSTTGNEPMLPLSHSVASNLTTRSYGDTTLGVLMDDAEEGDHEQPQRYPSQRSTRSSHHRNSQQSAQPRYDDEDGESYYELDENPTHATLRPPGPSIAPETSPEYHSTESESWINQEQPRASETGPQDYTGPPETPSGGYGDEHPTYEPYNEYGEAAGGSGGMPPGPPPGPGPYDSPAVHFGDDLNDEDEFDEKAAKKPFMPKEQGISLWNWYCRLLTFPVIPAMMRPFGMVTEERQMAWREKIGLISVILMVGAIVGFLTFGFTESVCDNTSVRVKLDQVTSDNLILFGSIYEFGSWGHPAVEGISNDSPIAYPPVNAGGKDVSFMFQNVNGHCSRFITPRSNSSIPHNSDGDMGWYFPCQVIYPHNVSLMDRDIMVNDPNTTDFYNGWGCHTHQNARDELYQRSNKTATVYYNWDDLLTSGSNLLVFNGDVINLDYLDYLLTDDLEYPEFFDNLRNDKQLRGQDVSEHFSFGDQRNMMQCLREIAKVGEIDTDTIGCIASKVVLYTSLVFIIGLVGVKFVLACYFRFFIVPKQGAFPISGTEFNERERDIEDWGDDEFTPARSFKETPKVGRGRPKSIILEKLTAPHVDPNRISRVTMSTQNPTGGTSRVVPGGSVHNMSLYRYSRPPTILQDNASNPFSASSPGLQSLTNVDTAYRGNEPDSISLQDLPTPVPLRSQTTSPYPQSTNDSEFAASVGPLGPIGGQTEYLVPQPPVDYQPWGYPLAHTICMVTAYSESVEGLRTTLDSLATTEYPNSHKMLFIVCDGLVKGSGNNMTTPEICLSMMADFAIPVEEVQAYSYVSVVAGSKRHNMAKVYAGFYKYDDATVDPQRQQRVPAICVVKCGTPAEANDAKPGNRGKRDSQVILMSFLQRTMFDERMTELEFELFNGILSVTGIPPDFYETLLMVDADTKVYPDCITHMNAEMVKDPEIMGLCGETKIANKRETWVTMIQVFEYFISHHQAKAFEAIFGGVTCLPGCFSMYRIKSPKGAEGFWVPILCNPDIVERYSDNVTDTLHKKNLLLLGEDRYLSTLMLKTFPKRKMTFVPKAACKTLAPDSFKVLLSQRRRWINSTIHNLMELLLVSDLCGVFVISMQFVVFIDLVSTLVLPAAISFTLYIVIIAIVRKPTPTMSLILLALILGLPGLLIVVTATRASYVVWMLIYLAALPIWNFVLPMNAYWRFDDFSWGDTRTIEGGDKGGHDEVSGEFDSSQIVMKRWREFQRDKEYQRMQEIQDFS